MSRREQKTQRNVARYRDFMPRRMRTNYAIGMQQTRVDMYVQLLEELCLSRFTWEGLPASVDARFLELTLLNNGVALWFFNQEQMRFMATMCTYGGRINVYLNPTRFTPYGNGFTYRTLTSKECVPIWDNLSRGSILDTIAVYANRLALLDRALDVNLDNLSIPLIIACDEKSKLSVENILRQRGEGLAAIYTYDSMDATSMFQTFPNVTPFVADKILQAKSQIWNEAMAFCGIQTNSVEKAERVQSAEVERAQERTNIFRLGYLKARQQAADQINAMWPHLHVRPVWADNTTGGIIDANGTGTEE